MKLQTLDVQCPKCGARPGWSCQSGRNRPRRPHPERVAASRAEEKRL